MKKTFQILLIVIAFFLICYILRGCYDKGDLDSAYEEGRESGYEDGYNAGYGEGYDLGYETGYDAGREDVFAGL